ncbi:hypothetical protein AB6A40_009091 [Gnathostoma spinigerum]|uniref:G-protein coupled receptors family 1 profile domain-containing protein n=1 Tax=Gnathostoma spinigerum TaxID=75299 RepID=A0ABD6EZY1_9BILA
MGFLLLKININISDLLILTILAVGKLCWLATYEWVGGDVLCKLFNFLSMFTLYISSNIVVCIALDRLRTVLGASRVRSGTSNVVRFMIVLSWLLAFIWSLPQLYVWRTIDVFPQHPGGWVQCSDIWSILRFEGWNVSENDIFLGDMARNAYDLSHLVSIATIYGDFPWEHYVIPYQHP